MNARRNLACTLTHIKFPCGADLAVSWEFTFAQITVTMPYDAPTPKVEIRFFQN